MYLHLSFSQSLSQAEKDERGHKYWDKVKSATCKENVLRISMTGEAF